MTTLVLSLLLSFQDAPVVVTTPVDVQQLAALGVQVPPSAKSHIQVLVKTGDRAVLAVRVAIKGTYNAEPVDAHVVVEMNEHGAIAEFPFAAPYNVQLSQVEVLPLKAQVSGPNGSPMWVTYRRGQTGLWTSTNVVE